MGLLQSWISDGETVPAVDFFVGSFPRLMITFLSVPTSHMSI